MKCDDKYRYIKRDLSIYIGNKSNISQFIDNFRKHRYHIGKYRYCVQRKINIAKYRYFTDTFSTSTKSSKADEPQSHIPMAACLATKLMENLYLDGHLALPGPACVWMMSQFGLVVELKVLCCSKREISRNREMNKTSPPIISPRQHTQKMTHMHSCTHL